MASLLWVGLNRPVNANHRKKNRGWVGAPVAFVVRQSHAAVIEELVSRHLWQPIDMYS